MGTTSLCFAGRTAIVTGAGNGLGRDYALELARRGASVVVNDLGTSFDGKGRSSASADAVVSEITAAGGKAVASYESVASAAGGEKIVLTAINAFGRVDILISNAGVIRNATFDAIPDGDIDLLVDTHLKGGFHVARPAFCHMKAQRYGRIVFASSSAGLFGNIEQAAYGAAKAGLIGLMKVLALEGAEYGVLANAIVPSAFTRMSQTMPAPQLDRYMEVFKSLGDRLGSALEPRFVTPLVTFLASEACQETQSIFEACLGRYARVVIGTTHGWLGGQAQPATAEDIAAHFSEIVADTGLREFRGIADEYADVIHAINEKACA
jgi:NAD(P)-dependent dehydrogenase (short-subunit alcohol dehydrogenase family)